MSEEESNDICNITFEHGNLKGTKCQGEVGKCIHSKMQKNKREDDGEDVDYCEELEHEESEKLILELSGNFEAITNEETKYCNYIKKKWRTVQKCAWKMSTSQTNDQ